MSNSFVPTMKIENEAFNTLKNQGRHFEHNYGHGPKNLAVVFAMLMMLVTYLQVSFGSRHPTNASR